MSSYFDQVEQTMGDAVQRFAHRPWYLRLLQGARRRPGLVVVLAALVVAAPAVGAVSHWYGIGAPNHPKSQGRAMGVGSAVPGKSMLLTLRVRDPQGGPPWGIRIVKAEDGSCLNFGRVEDGLLGSLGIDGYWHDDHLFHPYPANWVGEACGSDGDGGGVGGSGTALVDASANIPAYHDGIQTDGCTVNPATTAGRPGCPRGSLRMVIVASLGPQVRSITYRAPDGTLHTQLSHSQDGIFLLVFPVDRATCGYYLGGRLTRSGACERSDRPRPAGPRDPLTAAIKAIHLTDGKSCAVRGLSLLGNCPIR